MPYDNLMDALSDRDQLKDILGINISSQPETIVDDRVFNQRRDIARALGALYAGPDLRRDVYKRYCSFHGVGKASNEYWNTKYQLGAFIKNFRVNQMLISCVGNSSVSVQPVSGKHRVFNNANSTAAPTTTSRFLFTHTYKNTRKVTSMIVERELEKTEGSIDLSGKVNFGGSATEGNAKTTTGSASNFSVELEAKLGVKNTYEFEITNTDILEEYSEEEQTVEYEWPVTVIAPGQRLFGIGGVIQITRRFDWAAFFELDADFVGGFAEEMGAHYNLSSAISNPEDRWYWTEGNYVDESWTVVDPDVLSID